MADDIAIKVDRVSKTFKLPHERSSSVKSAIVNFYKRDKGFDKQQVLKNISFEIKKGEFFGIVGRNGSGKSTLLKLLAGIYSQDEGSIQVNGKLTPFIELGVGFNPELTGRENVFLNGALLGFDRKEMQAMYHDIVAFAELEEFMEQKLKNYSSGMQVRLAFSVAIRVQSDILLIDEVLAVGDQSFQEKCFSYFSQIKDSSKTVIFVTHDMSNVERFCDRVLVVDKNKSVNGLYTIPEAVALYNKLNHVVDDIDVTNHSANGRQAYIKKVELLDEHDKPTTAFKQGKAIKIAITLANSAKVAGTPAVIGLAFRDQDNVNLAGPNSLYEHISLENQVVEYRVDKLPLNMGDYNMTIALYDKNLALQYDIVDKGIHFFVNTDQVYYGKVVLEGKWSTKKVA